MEKVILGNHEIELYTHTPLVGEKAPNFTAMNDKFEPVSLSNFSGHNILISAFPSIDTPVCAIQTKRFNKDVEAFSGLKSISISVDSPFALKRFCLAEGINNMVTLSDANHLEFTTRYGLLLKELRISARAVVVIDKDMIIRHIEVVKNMADEPNFELAMNVLSKLP